MNGRLENQIKNETATEKKLENMPDFVKRWYVELGSRGMEATSRKDYVSRIYRFLAFVDENVENVTPDDITSDIITEYLDAARYKVDANGQKMTTSNSYRNGIRWALNSLLGFMCNHGYLKENPLSKIAKPISRPDEVKRIRVTEYDFAAIMEEAKKETNPVRRSRNLAILSIFMTTGVRETALCSINVDDIDFRNNKMVVIDKEAKMFEYAISPKTMNYIQNWMKYRNRTDRHELFLSQKGNRLSTDAVADLVAKYSKKALGYTLSPHKLRAGYCSILYSKTGNLEEVRRAVRHNSAQTTMKYTVTEGAEQKEAANMMDNYL